MMLLSLLIILFSYSHGNILSMVDGKLSDIRTIKIYFIQKVKYRWFPDIELSKGMFYADRKGRFRVEYLYPEKTTIVCDGDKIMIHYIEDGEVIVDKVSNNRSSVIEALFLFSRPLEDVFSLVGEIVEGEYKKLILKPKEEDDIIEEVNLYIDADMNIKGIEVTDKEGNDIYIEIRDLRKNYRPSRHLFDVLIPAGVNVRKTY